MGKYKRRPRLKHFDYTGCHRYFITICTHNKIPVFNNEEIAKRYIGLLAEKAISLHFKVWAYCFMPEHVHFLSEGMAQDADLKKFVSSFKQSSGYHFSTFIKAKLWQPSFYDHVLRKDEDLLETVKYIFNNPVRKKIVEHYQDYQWSGSFELDGKL